MKQQKRRKKSKPQVKSLRKKYDSAWKVVIKNLFKEFLEFFFKKAHDDIDFSKPCVFLDKELQQITAKGKPGTRIADQLVQVRLKTGDPACIGIFVHIEVQGKKDPNFIKRVFVCNYRIFDFFWGKKDIEVISMAVLTDEDPDYCPNKFDVNLWDFEHLFKIPLVKLVEWQIDEKKRKELETSENPMAMVVKAHLKSLELKKSDDDHKYEAKKELIRECYRKGYTKEWIRILLMFIDWIIRLPDKYEQKLSNEVIAYEEVNKMEYVTSFERLAMRRGKRVGIREGKKEGKIEGKKEGEIEGEKNGWEKAQLAIAKRLIEDNQPLEKIAKFTQLPENKIQSLMH